MSWYALTQATENKISGGGSVSQVPVIPPERDFELRVERGIIVETGESSGRFKAGTELTVRAGDPPSGTNRFDVWLESLEPDFTEERVSLYAADPSAPTTGYIMPEYDIRLEATFNFVNEPPVRSTLTVINGTGSGSFVTGQTIIVRANNPPDDNHRFDCWTGDSGILDNPDAIRTLGTMPGRDVTVEATYKRIPFDPPGDGSGNWEPQTLVSGIIPWAHSNFIEDQPVDGRVPTFKRWKLGVLHWPAVMSHVRIDSRSMSETRSGAFQIVIASSRSDMGAVIPAAMGANRHGMLGSSSLDTVVTHFIETNWFNGDIDLTTRLPASWDSWQPLMGPSNMLGVINGIIHFTGRLIARNAVLRTVDRPLALQNVGAGIGDIAYLTERLAVKRDGSVHAIHFERPNDALISSARRVVSLSPIGARQYKQVRGWLAIGEDDRLYSRFWGHGLDVPYVETILLGGSIDRIYGYDDYMLVEDLANVEFSSLVDNGPGAIDVDGTLWVCGNLGVDLGTEVIRRTFTSDSWTEFEVPRSTDNRFIKRLENVKKALFSVIYSGARLISAPNDIDWTFHPYRVFGIAHIPGVVSGSYPSQLVALMNDATLKVTGGDINLGAQHTSITYFDSEMDNITITQPIDRFLHTYTLFGNEPGKHLVFTHQEDRGRVSVPNTDRTTIRIRESTIVGNYAFDFVDCPLGPDTLAVDIFIARGLLFATVGVKKEED